MIEKELKKHLRAFRKDGHTWGEVAKEAGKHGCLSSYGTPYSGAGIQVKYFKDTTKRKMPATKISSLKKVGGTIWKEKALRCKEVASLSSFSDKEKMEMIKRVFG